MGTTERLAALDDAFAKADTSADGDRLPDGDYTATLIDSYVATAPWDDNVDQWTQEWQADFEFDGEKRTGTIRKWLTLNDQARFKYAKRDLQTLGYDGRLSELPGRAPMLKGSVAEINVATKQGDTKQFVNVYVNRLVGKVELPDDAPAADEDDSIPF
jgi:hypothetical protein